MTIENNDEFTLIESTEVVAEGAKETELGKTIAPKPADDQAITDQVQKTATEDEKKLGVAGTEYTPRFKKIDESVFKGALQKDLGELFESSEFDAATKEKIATIFEAAVEMRVKAEIENLNEFGSTYFQTQVEECVTEIKAKNELFMEHVAEQWVTENKIGLETGIRVELAESLMQGIRSLLEDHNVELPTGGYDVIKEKEEELVALKKQLDESILAQAAMQKTITESQKAAAFNEFTRGMTEVAVEKLRKLCESVEFTDIAAYQNSLSVLKENFLKPAAKPAPKQEEAVITEGIQTEEKKDPVVLKEDIDPAVAAVAGHMSRYSK